VRDLVIEALARELEPLGLHRNGEEFRRHVESGDGIVVAYGEVDPLEGDNAFFVHVGLINVPWLEWVTHGREQPLPPPEQATVDEAMVRYQVGSFLQGIPWVLRADNAQAVLAAMQASVGATVREYLPLLDRTVLLDKLRRNDRISGFVNRPAGLVILLASQGIDHEFVERFGALRRVRADWLDWIWNYALRHTPPGATIPPRPSPL
jgi:hypothetical protein